jgi:hypothetical protein
LGFDTYALYVAFYLGLKSISYLPSSNRNCTLPLPSSNQIKQLKDLDIENISYGEKEIFGINFKDWSDLYL